jgi:glycosyltransferase involved in cell wall biosynthesis
MNNLISVIIPTYNRENFIKETIDSVLNQTYKNIEILIVDDGSTDNTREIIESINDPRIIYIYQDNTGASASRNTGIKNAKGEYVAFLDSDDSWLPDKLEKQIKFIQNNPQIDICGGWILQFDEKSNKIWKLYSEPSDIKAYNLFNNPLFQTTVLLKKEVLYEYNVFYNPEYKSSNDYDFFSRLLEFAEPYNIPEILAKYRTHYNQLSTKTRSEQNNYSKQIKLNLLKKMNLEPTEEELDLHQSITLLTFNANCDTFKKFNIWFEKLIIANKKTKIYSEFSFNKIICDYWLSIIAVSKNKALLAFIYFLIAPLPIKLKIELFSKRLIVNIQNRIISRI